MPPVTTTAAVTTAATKTTVEMTARETAVKARYGNHGGNQRDENQADERT